MFQAAQRTTVVAARKRADAQADRPIPPLQKYHLHGDAIPATSEQHRATCIGRCCVDTSRILTQSLESIIVNSIVFTFDR